MRKAVPVVSSYISSNLQISLAASNDFDSDSKLQQKF